MCTRGEKLQIVLTVYNILLTIQMPLKKSIPDTPFEGLEEQAVPRMEAWSSFRRCYLNPHVWDLLYFCMNSGRVLSLASSFVLHVHLPTAQPKGRGGNVTPKLWKTLFGKFICLCLQLLGVSGALQLCHLLLFWEHLLLSLQRGTELPSHLHEGFPAVIPDSWGLQGLPTLLVFAVPCIS